MAAFCRERGVCAPLFFAWKKRLGEGAAAQFVEVKVAAEAPEARAARGAAIEIRLKNDHSLLVGPGFDPDHLRALLAVVESEARVPYSFALCE